MSASGNELGDLLVDIGIITPEELASAIAEQAKSGERLTAVLDKLGLVNHNQLKDSLELQFGVNFIDLIKAPPAPEVAKLVSQELKRKHRFIPVAASGTQFTVAMVNPDDLIALDILRVQLRSGHLKKMVCIADDLEFVLQELYKEEQPTAPPAVQPTPVTISAPPSAPAQAGKKVEAKNHLRKLFDDDDDDDLESVVAPASPEPAVTAPPTLPVTPVAAQAPIQAPVEAPVDSGSAAPPAVAMPAPATTAAVPAFTKLPDESLVELPTQQGVLEITQPAGRNGTALMENKAAQVAAIESSMDAAVASVTSALLESSQSLPINNDANRQLLEEVVESELGTDAETDIQSMKEAQNASVMLLAHEIIGKASQKRCSDIHLEPDKSGVALRYFLHGELLADCMLPLEIHKALVGSYKIIAGLDPKEINKPQDKKFTCIVEESEIELRITTLPSEIGEMVAISMRYVD